VKAGYGIQCDRSQAADAAHPTTEETKKGWSDRNMFRCEQCGEVVSPGIAAVKCVVETRNREYPLRQNTSARPGKSKGRRGRRPDDPGGSGCEIVRELELCPSCAESIGDAADAGI
jgi:hypothetical protein